MQARLLVGMGAPDAFNFYNGSTLGRLTLRLVAIITACAVFLAGCSRPPKTDDELAADAQRAVNLKLGVQAQYSLMESTVEQQIACGHAAGPGIGERDFVYRSGNVILDDDPDFDGAAVQCDAAIGGGSPAPDNNSSD